MTFQGHCLIMQYFYLSGVSGYVAANLYRKMSGDNWVWNINLTSCLFSCKSKFISDERKKKFIPVNFTSLSIVSCCTVDSQKIV